jgi:hypothetical protein
MTNKSGIRKSREQELSKVINQMDYWMQHKTRLILSISTPLFHLFLRGRMVGRQECLFLFDSYGEACRIPITPERYDRLRCNQTGTASLTLGISGMQGELVIGEDGREAGIAETCADWVLSNLVDGAHCSDEAEQEVPVGVPITQRERHP